MIIDIIKKEFLAVHFEPDGILTCNEVYNQFLGFTGIVTNTHAEFPQYARVEFKDAKGRIDALHFPVKVVKEQLRLNAFKETPEYTKYLFKEIINLIKKT